MVAAKKSSTREDEALFVRALVQAASAFAPSVDALRLEVARRMLDAQGMPDLVDLFAEREQAHKATTRATPRANGKRGRRSALDPSTPITVALAGVRRHGTFAANGISTLKQASKYTEEELTAIPGIGPGLISAIKEALPRASLALRAEAA